MESTLKEVIAFFLWILTKFSYDKMDEWKKEKLERTEHDKKLFSRIKEQLLPKEEMEFFLRWHPYDSFAMQNISQIQQFASKDYRDPEYKFFDKELERSRQSLFEATRMAIGWINIEVFYNKNCDGSFWVPSEWEFDDPERFRKAVDRLSQLSTVVRKEYETFLSLGKNKFSI